MINGTFVLARSGFEGLNKQEIIKQICEITQDKTLHELYPELHKLILNKLQLLAVRLA